jgi:hypothetical protein
MFIGKLKDNSKYILFESKRCSDPERGWWRYANFVLLECSIADVKDNKEHFLKVMPLLTKHDLNAGETIEEVEL